MQQNITEQGKNASAGLMISTQQKTLSKQQQTFNRFIKKIEKLRSVIVEVQKLLDEKLDFYSKNIYPLEKKLSELNKEAAKLLFNFFKNKKLLPKKQRHNLGGVIASLLHEIFQFENGEPEDELKIIFKAVQGISYEKAVEQDFETMKNDMESMFDEFGFKMNFDGLHSKMTQEEIMQKTMEMEDKLKQLAEAKEQQQAAKKKTKKQLEKEEKAKQIQEARAKNISSIYKQLAKILHPDLEQDEALKLQKEELMKQLTNAYENNDLHTLLYLELTWIQNEENNPGKITDDKLGIYNEVLKEQISELEDELEALSEHPRYQPLQKFALFPFNVRDINIKHEKHLLETKCQLVSSENALLKGNEKQALSIIKKRLYDFEHEKKFIIDFSLDEGSDEFF